MALYFIFSIQYLYCLNTLWYVTVSIVEFLKERVSNILAFTQFMGCGGFFSPTNGYHFNRFFFFCQVQARSIFVLLLLLSNCDLFTRSDSCFLSRRAEMQEGQMHWSSTHYQILSHTHFEKLIASNNLTQGSFYTSLSFYS